MDDGPGAFDRDEFTLVAWDPPGCGYSRPPERKSLYCPDLLAKDAQVAATLMQRLGFKQYSLIGWSDGAKTAFYMAQANPSRVIKIVTIGGHCRAGDDECARLKAGINVNEWPAQYLKLYQAVYGAEFGAIWAEHVNWYYRDRPHCPAEVLGQVRCPVLMCHGDKDPVVTLAHAQLTASNLRDCQLERFAKAAHNLHQQFPEEFKIAAENFLLDY